MKSFLLVLFVCGLALQTYANSYTTTFSGANETPLSEGGGRWNGGLSQGLDWEDMSVSNHVAISLSFDGNFKDSTAILTGTWANDQTATATCQITYQGNNFPELELKLLSAVSAHSSTGYEFLYSCETNNNYISIVRWNGALGAFTVLTNWQNGSTPKLTNGCTLKAQSIGTNLYLYLNSTLLMVTNDWAGTMWTGAPGIGSEASGAANGFTSFTATDTATITNTATLQLNVATLQLNNATLQIK